MLDGKSVSIGYWWNKNCGGGGDWKWYVGWLLVGGNVMWWGSIIGVSVGNVDYILLIFGWFYCCCFNWYY